MKLPPGADAELGEHLAEVPLDGALADVEPLADLGVREPVGRELRDVRLLGGQGEARVIGARAGVAARGVQLAPSPLRKPRSLAAEVFLD